MSVFRNPNRLRELFSPATLADAADGVLALRHRGVIRVLCYLWLATLGCVFSLLVVVRLALTIPVWR